jgi:large subunit ribosomal protein L24
MERKLNKQQKFHIRKGDTVKVISGDSKGKTGKVVTILTSDSKAIIEGINIVTKHTKPSASQPNGGIVKKEAPVHISNIALIDPATGNTTKVGRKLNSEGKLERISKKTGGVIKNG